MIKFNVLMGKHLSVIGVLQEDLSPGGAVCQNLRKGIVNWKGRLDTHEVLKNCLSSHDFHKNGTKCIEKKLSNYGYLNATNSLKPRLAVHVSFLRKHIESRAKALSNRQDFFNTGFTTAYQASFFFE